MTINFGALPAGYDDPAVLLKRLRTEPEEEWIKRGEFRALALFQAMARRVPAYKDFLRRHGVKPAQIKTAADFKLIPPVDKENYLCRYPRAELCWDGRFKEASWVVSTTSGSTGEPYYFPRRDLQDDMYALSAELYLRSNFRIHERSTLYIVAFAMGPWIGGLFTYEAVKKVAERGYRLTIFTPGINKAEVVKAVQTLGPDFDQVIIGSYPPILKDIIDEGITAGLDWSDYNLKVVFSAEGFNETFRDYVIEHGSLKDPLTDTLNHYGTVDLGTMSHETPLAVLTRRLLLQNEDAYDEVFEQTTKLPTLTQYDPSLFYFEEDNDILYCTSNSGLPLVRYNLKDHGGVITKSELEKRLASHGIDLELEAASNNISETIWNLPFVHVYERADFSVKFLGFEVFPEPIRKALNQPALHTDVTGKFTLLSDYDDRSVQQLQVHVELKAGVRPTSALAARTSELIVQYLERDNPVYRMNRQTDPRRTDPVVTFWSYGHDLYFSGKGKQQWVKR